MDVQNAVLLVDSTSTAHSRGYLEQKCPYKSQLDKIRRVKWAVRSASVVSWHAVLVQFLVCLLRLNRYRILMYRNAAPCSMSL